MNAKAQGILFVFLLAVFLFPAFASAATYYVATNGNDANVGTSTSSPWRTIQHAADIAVAGDTVYVMGGTYNEQVSVKHSGSNGKYITFVAYPGHTPVIDGTGINMVLSYGRDGGLFQVWDQSYIKVTGFTIKNSGYAGMFAQASSSSNPPPHDIIYEGNTIVDTWGPAMLMQGGGSSNSYNYVARNNMIIRSHIGGDPMAHETLSFASGIDGFEISGNIITDSHFGGIDAKNGVFNGKIFRNTCTRSAVGCIYVDAYDRGASNIDVYENVAHDQVKEGENDVISGFDFAAEQAGTLSNVRFYNNLAYNNPGHGMMMGWYSKGPVKDVTITGNTFVNNGNGNQYGCGIVLQAITNGGSSSNIIVRNNIVSQNNGCQIWNEAAGALIENNLIDGFRGTYAPETRGNNYVEGNPLFINPSAGDFHIQSTSPAIDKGSSTSFVPATDFDGKARPQGNGYDIGAYEYSSTTTPPPTCTPSWKCESPLNGYEYDGCSSRRLNAACNAPTPQSQSPYGGTARAIPGTIQAEDFDNGGEGVAYHDSEAANQGNSYRTGEGVDIEASSAGGYNIGWTLAGEWLEYSVNAASAGTYSIEIPVASYGSGGTFHIEFNGVDKTGTMTVPDTGGWQAWTTLTKSVSLSAGTQIIKIVMDTVGATGNMGNIDYIKISSGTTPPPACTPSWKCESPLNGYESDGCNNRRLNSACNAPAPTPSSNTYYVATNGNDANPGTESQPWRTIQKAANTLTAGQTVYVKSGTYNEKIFAKNSGSPGNYITFSAYPGQTPIIDGTGISGIPSYGGTARDEGLFTIWSLSYIKVTGFKLINSPYAGLYANTAGNLDPPIHDIIFEGNTIVDSWAVAILINSRSPTDAYNIAARNNVIIRGHMGGDPMAHETLSFAGNMYNIEISGNLIQDSFWGGIDIKDGVHDSKIFGNTCTNTEFTCIYINGAPDFGQDKPIENIEVYNNKVYNMKSTSSAGTETWSSGINVATENAGNVKNIRVYNNIIYNNPGNAIRLAGYAASTGQVDNVVFESNTIYNNGNGYGRGAFSLEYAKATNTVIRNNIMFKNEYGIQNSGGLSIVNSNNLESDPSFVNPSSADFHLQSTSSAIDKGASLSAPYNVDFDGKARPQGNGYDIGAYEYSSTTTPPPTCTPSWKCESPLNGYESDGCNNRRLNSACNAPTPTSGNIYYVATNGNDANSGTETSPWRTIQKAANTLTAGQTVYVKSGTYNEKVSITKSGTANNYITFTNYPGHTVTIDGTGLLVWDKNWKGIVEITGNVNYVKISGLRIINSDVFAIMVASWSGPVSNIIIENNYIANNFNAGIMVQASSNILIDNNELTLNQKATGIDKLKQIGETITLHGVSNFEVRNNKIYNSRGENINAKGGSYNGKIHHNDISGHESAGIYLDSWDTNEYNIDVYNNRIHDSSMSGARGIAIAVENYGSINGIKVYNNLIYNNAAMGLDIAWYSNGPINNVELTNNIIYNNGLVDAWGGGIELSATKSTSSNIVTRNNIIYNNRNYQFNNGIGSVSDSNLIATNPLFVNPSLGDFHLQSGSPAIDKGSSTSFVPATDFDGKARPQGNGYDIGAYEYSSTTTPPPTCTPSWKCESPLNGYESDGCNNRRLNSACNAPAPQSQSPYGGTARAIPGTIQAEDFDNGGEGIAYHDIETANQGNSYRTGDGVDIEASSAGGYNIGWTLAGEWLEYSVNAASAGTYSIEIPVASYGSGGTFHIEFNGVDKTGTMTVPDTGGWQSWATLTKSVSLSAGTQVMKLVMDTVGATGNMGNINYVKLSSGTTPPPTCTPSWKCESPLNGYESDGCNNRRLNSACNAPAPAPQPICTPSWECESPLNGYESDGCNNRRLNVACNSPAPAGTSLAAATDNNLAWTTGGNANWFGETSTYYYGNDAAQSGKIGDSQTTWIQTTVTGPGKVTFYWKVSSEPYYDYLKFYVDGVLKSRISGTVNWNSKSYTLTSGMHTLKWAYAKDKNTVKGSDAGWVDKVVYTPSTPTGAFWWPV